jgi:hypothetical protein
MCVERLDSGRRFAGVRMATTTDYTAGFTDWLERATAWRRRAEQLKMIAGAMSDTAARAALTRQATQWARMAEEAEFLAAEWQRRNDEALHKH